MVGEISTTSLDDSSQKNHFETPPQPGTKERKNFLASGTTDKDISPEEEQETRKGTYSYPVNYYYLINYYLSILRSWTK